MKDTDHIIAYLQHRLSTAETDAFERKLQSDHHLRDQVHETRLALKAIDSAIAQDLRTKIRSADSQVSAPKRNKKSIVFLGIGLLILLMSAYLAYSQYQSVKAAGYREYAMVDPDSFATRGTVQEDVKAFITAFKLGDLGTMQELLETGNLAQYDRRTDLQLLKAQAHWQQGDYQAAEHIYEVLEDLPLAKDKAALQQLYYLSKTRQEEAYESLYDQLSKKDDYIFLQEVQDLHKHRSGWPSRMWY